eukprot:TRINITY_DN9804_c0_g1_i4.p1 TRINITY_DN9804_c0_g1~~TRINITY_DN9804_c0_g1_i4.p1  ORF type:complete len:178 (+),score=12.01 TRINITY_DN9804_c0_g1_i4:385-918(+)
MNFTVNMKKIMSDIIRRCYQRQRSVLRQRQNKSCYSTTFTNETNFVGLSSRETKLDRSLENYKDFFSKLTSYNKPTAFVNRHKVAKASTKKTKPITKFTRNFSTKYRANTHIHSSPPQIDQSCFFVSSAPIYKIRKRLNQCLQKDTSAQSNFTKTKKLHVRINMSRLMLAENAKAEF